MTTGDESPPAPQTDEPLTRDQQFDRWVEANADTQRKAMYAAELAMAQRMLAATSALPTLTAAERRALTHPLGPYLPPDIHDSIMRHDKLPTMSSGPADSDSSARDDAAKDTDGTED